MNRRYAGDHFIETSLRHSPFLFLEKNVVSANVQTLCRGVLQLLSISSLWACLWTLTMAVSRTTGAADTSWSRGCSCPVRGALTPAAASTASNPPTCCSRYSAERRIIHSGWIYGLRCHVPGLWVCMCVFVYASHYRGCAEELILLLASR